MFPELSVFPNTMLDHIYLSFLSQAKGQNEHQETLVSGFSCYNPPWLWLQKTLAYLFNKLGSACMTHPPDHFDLTAPVTPMLPKAAFSFPAAQLPTAMLLCLVKIKGRLQGAQFCSECLLQASRELPRAISFERVSLQQEQTFSFPF